MTQKAFYDWQTAGGGGDVTHLIAVIEAQLPKAVRQRLRS